MLIIIDKRLPAEAKKKLREYGELMELETKGITYDAISGHPDIFFCLAGGKLVAAPNLPENYLAILDRNHINYQLGRSPVGKTYPQTAIYNATAHRSHFIHNLKITDETLLDAIAGMETVHVSQGYTRCNLVLLKDNHCLTSDPGILHSLEHNFKVLFVPVEEIILPGFDHGFIGGICGIYKDNIFFAGSLDFHSEGNKIRELLMKLGYRVIELHHGPLFDGGGVLFV